MTDMYPYYGVALKPYIAMDRFYMFLTTLLGILGGLFSMLLGLAHLKKQLVSRQADLMNILYIHLSFNNFAKSVVAVLYGAVVLQTPWLQSVYYKITHRTTEAMSNNGSFIYCNIMGPLQEVTVVQGVLLLCFLVCFKVSTKYFPTVRHLLSKKRRIANVIIGVGWAISITGSVCTFAVGETFYMDNLSGFCYTTENNSLPGIAILFFCIPPLLSCLVIGVMLVVMIYQYYMERNLEEQPGSPVQDRSSRTVVILIYTAVFVLCEAPLWIIYFIYNCRVGVQWMGGNTDANEYNYGLFYHRYVRSVLENDFSYIGHDLYIAMRYYPMYTQLTLTIETFIQTATLLTLQQGILDWLYKMATNRNMVRSFTKIYKDTGEHGATKTRDSEGENSLQDTTVL